MSQPVSGVRHVASLDGVQVALHELGGEGPPLLMCHATGFCARAYDPLVALLRHRFAVWAVDLRGHGLSSAPANGDFAWDRSAQDVLAALDAAGLGPVVAFGHSLGGAITLLAEAARPGTVSAAYLFEPIVWPVGFAHPDGVNPMAAGAVRRREVFASRAEALARYAVRPPLGNLRADCLAAYVEAGFEDLADNKVRLRCRAASEAATFAAEEVVTVDRIAEVRAKVTVAVGGRTARPDGSGPAALGAGIVAALPDAVLRRYPALGHFGPLQDPDTIAEDVAEVLGAAPGPPA